MIRIRIVRLLFPIVLAGHSFAFATDARWPSFRGDRAAGVADDQNLPEKWDGTTGENVAWKTTIPGLAHSSPVVWDGKVFVTTAISSRADASFRSGLFGAGDASDDLSSQRWVVYCIDLEEGSVIWERTAHEGIPKFKRHTKSTYASATPATDGRYVVASFGSEGLHAFTMDGTPAWKVDLGDLDVGAYNARDYEWGPASSPIIHGDLVIVQCDTQDEDFLLAVDIQTGKTAWRAAREELSSWGTPSVVEAEGRAQIVTNASNFIRGYDAVTGAELWRLGGSSKITTPTPIFAEGLIIVASGRGPERPIFAIRPGARGDFTLARGETSNEFVAWSKTKVGPYMPTPLAYRGALYTMANDGIFAAYEVETGTELYRERVEGAGGGFSASPVASDGKIYVAGEDGDVFVFEAGREFKFLARNPMGERLMATPAIAARKMLIRAEHHLFAIGNDK